MFKHAHYTVKYCPFNCTNFTPCTIFELDNHLKWECTSSELRCQKCDLNIYCRYAGKDLDVVGGHICERDLREEIRIMMRRFEVEEAKNHEPRH